ncbi:MAG: protein kinase, partial [Myxococcota bacterium]
MHLSVGQQIGNYTLRYRLGRGGMAEVWAARHRVLNVDVALKALFSGSPTLQSRLLREGRAQAAMNHPNILPVRDVIDVHGAPGLVLPLIKGPSLDTLLQKYRPTTDEAVALFRAIVEGVGHAHACGLIHRDLKPGNILLEEQRGRIVPRVADFGLVKGSDETEQAPSALTRAHAMMGTFAYAAPEQLLDASNVDHRADLFSLGVILVELLTGKLPFQAVSWKALLAAYEAGPALHAAPQALAPLCRKLLAFEANERLSRCADLLDGLNAAHPSDSGRALGPTSTLAKAIQAPEPEFERTHQTIASPTATFTNSLFESTTLLPDLGRSPRSNLPAEVDVFIGRARALQVLEERLEGSRLISILGAGGAGKTRLALHFARQHLSRYPGGVFFCDLSEVQSLEGILFAVAKAMEVPLGQGDPRARLGHAIAGHQRCLLILDNFEQLTEHAAETVGAWMRRAEQARFVVTSRALLEVNGEVPLRLPPLDEAEAVALFVERASKKTRGFTLTDKNRRAVHQLVRLLDGLPLAIELATARIPMMTPALILKRMNRRFQLLSVGRRNILQRQATLRAAIDWSWALLEDWEKAAFAQCSVFEGGFTLEAAEGVLDLDMFEDAPWGMDAVQSLVDKSLLRLLGENPLGEMRFGMLMSLHEYAREKLSLQDAEAIRSLRQRHRSIYARFGEAESLDSLHRSWETSQWWALRAEVDNLLAALRSAVQAGAVEDAVPIALALFAIAERQQPDVVLATLNDTLSMPQLASNPQHHADIRFRLGRIHQHMGRNQSAEEHYMHALRIFRDLTNSRGEGETLLGLGVCCRLQGQLVTAEAYYQDALRIFRSIGYRRGEGDVLGNLGIIRGARGH